MDSHEILNVFFVRSFNKVLGIEEAAMSAGGGVSLAEAHTITAADTLSREGANTVSGIAHTLSLSLGAVSISVNSLVKKGYLCRRASSEDRRKVYILPTAKGKRIVTRHNHFHEKMIDGIVSSLTDEELALLSKSLVSLGEYFDRAGDEFYNHKKKPVRKAAGKQ